MQLNLNSVIFKVMVTNMFFGLISLFLKHHLFIQISHALESWMRTGTSISHLC